MNNRKQTNDNISAETLLSDIQKNIDGLILCIKQDMDARKISRERANTLFDKIIQMLIKSLPDNSEEK